MFYFFIDYIKFEISLILLYFKTFVYSLLFHLILYFLSPFLIFIHHIFLTILNYSSFKLSNFHSFNFIFYFKSLIFDYF